MMTSKYCRHCCRLLNPGKFRIIHSKRPQIRAKNRQVDGGPVINVVEQDEGYTERPQQYQCLSAWCKECEARHMRMKTPPNGPRKSHREGSYYTRQKDAQKELLAFLMRERRDNTGIVHKPERLSKSMD